MKIRTFAIGFTFAVGLVGIVDSRADEATDPIAASFDRDLNRVATPAPAATRHEIDDDELYFRINRQLQSSNEELTVITVDSDADETVADAETFVTTGE
jgi:hypothetical protein